MTYLTGQGLAATLKCSLAAVRKWKSQGMPHIKLSRLVRFELDRVLEWLAARSKNKESKGH
jgi:phage terminase Nu1 subunit (DNA packaging protein)